MNVRRARRTEHGLIANSITKAVDQLDAERAVMWQRLESEKSGTMRDAKDRPELSRPIYEEATEPIIEVGFGAIFGLARIAQDSKLNRIPIIETLCAYVREKSNAQKPEDYPESDWEKLPDDADKEARKVNEEERDRRFGIVIFGSGIARQWARALHQLRASVQTALHVIGRRSEGRRAYGARIEGRTSYRRS